jgi:hypothetical protein
MTLYRYRYHAAYTLLAATLAVALLGAIDKVPYGLSAAELDSAVASAGFSLASLAGGSWVDLPYHLLQKVTLLIWGPTPLGIRLPSVIIAIATVVLFVRLLQKWFHANIAVLAGILFATSVPMIALGRLGSSEILVPFWAVATLYAASHAAIDTRARGAWQLATLVAVVTSLYTPTAIYLVVALLLTAVAHPHSRYLLTSASLAQKIGVVIGGLLLTSPLLWWLATDSIGATEILGISQAEANWHGVVENARTIVRGIFGTSMVMSNAFTAPMVGFAMLALALLGAAQTFIHRHAVRSYVLTVWCVIMLPVILVRPDHLIVYFVPLALLMAIGLELLLDHWYSLFPRNPYARVAALLPMTLLLGGASVASMVQYTYTQLYAPQLAAVFTDDFRLVADKVSRTPGAITLVVPQPQVGHYRLLEGRRDNVSISTTIPSAASGSVWVLESTHATPPSSYRLVGTVVAGISDDALVAREYIAQ